MTRDHQGLTPKVGGKISIAFWTTLSIVPILLDASNASLDHRQLLLIFTASFSFFMFKTGW
ncbi:unnamed protein product, partial [Brassica rapa subsp. trilocularis]